LIEFINSNILPSQDIAITFAVMAIFLFAGIIKGFLGIGLPAAAMAFFDIGDGPNHCYFTADIADYLYQYHAIYAV
jgi:hypothetical protein